MTTAYDLLAAHPFLSGLTARHFGAVAVETTLTVAVDGPGIPQTCEQDPELGYDLTSGFIREVVQRLQATRRQLLDLPRDEA